MHFKIYAVFEIFIICFIDRFLCEDIFGCGGFVKSDFSINYSRVEIKLYTKHGSLKYQTDCAPNNGYYLIPLYDKGDYILKIEPPIGWSFEPSSVVLHVDGTTDPCSLNQDINFTFKGFTLSGQVLSRGEVTGPEGIHLLLKDVSGVFKNQTSTIKGGYYSFPTLFPGKYTIEASHELWAFDQASETIQVVQDNIKSKNSIVVSGYDVYGYVYSEGEPIPGVNFLVFSKKVIKTPLGCNPNKVKSFSQKVDIPYVCYVTSSNDGKFTFPSLSPGNYKLIPFYKGEHIEFDVSPPEIDFTVTEGSLQISQNFQVQGFSVSGWIGTGPKGKSLVGAEIFVNGVKHATSDSNGLYHLENMRAGTYIIDVKMPHIMFESASMRVNPNTPRLPDIYANKFSVCGHLMIDEYPIGLENPENKLTLKTIKGGHLAMIPVNSNGHFCFEASPGKYELEPSLSEAEINFGLKFIPEKHVIDISDEPLTNIVFKQFQAKVQGRVQCIESCTDLSVSLAPLSNDRPPVKATVSSDGKFEFEKCLPGNYLLTLMKDDWCFQSKTTKFNVINKDISNLEFKQTGYQVSIILSHASSFEVKYPSGEFHNIELKDFKNVLCLPEPGVYDFIPVGCHLYKKDVYKFDTNNPSEINLSPVKHLVTGSILTEMNVTDIKVHVKKHVNVVEDVISLQEPMNKKGDFYRYRFSVFAQPNSDLELKVTSKQLLFRPVIATVKVKEDCMENAVEIIGKKGLFVNGSVTPPLEGVRIQVFMKDNNITYAEIKTNEKGLFLVGPLENESDYTITAEKEGYVFSNLDKGKFFAYKLAEIVVELEENGIPLPGVLLSLSGGTDYRKNSVTQKDGKLSFTGLGPGQYFLRPMLKEYSFEPSAKMINIKEGTQEFVKISGKRVAYSLYGIVNSLTGEAEVGVAVEAVGLANSACSQYQEEAISEQGGLFRIRGLQPGCEYTLRLKPGAEVNQHIERATPSELLIKVTDGDITGIRLIAFRYYGQMDVSGNVVTSQEYLSSLKVRLYKEDIRDQIISSVSLDQSTFFYLPSMPIDKKTYVLRLETSLSSSAYQFEQPSVTFCANTSFYHFTFTFQPQVKSIDHEVTQGSILAFPLAIITVLIAYNYQKLLPLLIQSLHTISAMLNSTQSQTATESTSSESSNVRRKVRAKRAQ